MSTVNTNYANFDARYATASQLAAKANASTTAVGTVGASTTLPAVSYSVVTLTTTSATSAAITLPAAVAGQSFDLYVTNPASGTTGIPTFTPASGGSIIWTSPLSWVAALGATNIISFECAVAGTWQAYPITSGLGSSAPLQEQIYRAAAAGASQTVAGPLSSPYYTIYNYVLSANLNVTMPPISTAGGESFTLWIDQPSGGTYTLSFTGTVRWVSGSAPIAPSSTQRLWCTFVADASLSQWIGATVSTGF